MESAYIDEQLPFSEEEFYRAFRLVEPDPDARESAAFIVRVVRRANEQAQRARLSLAPGDQDDSSMEGPTWFIGDRAFALLSLVSDDLRVRVDAYMGAQWQGLRELLLRFGLYRPDGVILREPTSEEYAKVEAQIAVTAAEWRTVVERTRAEVEVFLSSPPTNPTAARTSRYIDENDLPFTEEELFRAFALTEDEQAARDAARTLSDLLSPGTYQGGWSISYEGFAALALLSDELRERVDAYMLPRWENMRPSLVHDALRQEGLPPGSEPTASALRAADEEIAGYIAEWRRGCTAFGEWVRRRQAGEPVGDEPPPWPGSEES